VPIDQYPADAFRDVVGERSDQPVPDREGCDPAPTRARERRLHRADQLRAGLARHAEHRCVHIGQARLIQNENTYRLFRPDLENPGRDDVVEAFESLNLLPVPWVQPDDVAEAVLYLAADSGRYLTGGTYRVDTGWNTK